jgi:ABC-type dipeptide/oligopeptide/nickel transport system permease subunit
VGAVSAVVVALLVFIAIWEAASSGDLAWVTFGLLDAGVVPSIAPHGSFETISGTRFQTPSWSHPFGVDDRSRDILSRVITGAKVSIIVGIVSVAIGIGGGSILGIISGYIGGKLDMLIQRIMDAWMSFPSLIMALSLAAILRPGMTTAMIAIGITILPSANRVVRGAAMSIKENVYVEAARTIGATDSRIMFRHVLPNLVAPILVMVSIMMGAAIIIEAGLSFLGLGVQRPNVSWGLMINEARAWLEPFPHLLIAPAIAIGVVVLSFNLLGDALRDYFDPSLRGRT